MIFVLQHVTVFCNQVSICLLSRNEITHEHRPQRPDLQRDQFRSDPCNCRHAGRETRHIADNRDQNHNPRAPHIVTLQH